LDRGAKNLRKHHPQWQPEQMVTWIYRSALSRPPTPAEMETARGILGTAPTEEGLNDLLWTVLMLPEFQMVR
jgi:hypothetical protein